MDPAPHEPVAPPFRARTAPPTPVSFAILALNVGAFAWVALHGSTTDTATLIRYGALERGHVWSGEWWRLLTAAFLHFGPFHLAANMVFGIPWCRQLERAFGSARFAGLYLLAAIGASAVSLLRAGTVSAGASGALFGVIGAALAIHRRGLGSWRAFFVHPASRPVLLNLAALAIAGFVLPIDQFAHGGGFVTGAAWGWIATRPPPRRRWPWLVLVGAVAAVVAIALRPDPRWVRARAEVAALQDVFALLDKGDVGEARARIDAMRARGVDPSVTDRVDYADAAVLASEGRVDAALRTLRKVEDAPGSQLRDDARRARARLARVAGTELTTRDRSAAERELGLRYLDEACSAGEQEACSIAQGVRAEEAR